MSVPSGRRVLLVVLVVSLVATGLLAIGILLFAEFDDTSGRILATTGLIGLFSLLCLPAAALLDRGRAQRLAYVTIGTAGVGLVLTLALLWGDVSSDPPSKAALTIGLLAGALAQASATTARRRETDSSAVHWLYVGAIVAAAAFAAMGAGAAWGDVDGETYYRFLGALAVADLLLVLLQPVARRIAAAPARAASRLVFTLDEEPTEEAVEAAVDALEASGVSVMKVDRRS
jgi:hypothetical protein